MDTTVQSTSVGYHMPVLNYSSNALTPVISQATVELHFGKHLRAYIDNYNGIETVHEEHRVWNALNRPSTIKLHGHSTW